MVTRLAVYVILIKQICYYWKQVHRIIAISHVIDKLITSYYYNLRYNKI